MLKVGLERVIWPEETKTVSYTSAEKSKVGFPDLDVNFDEQVCYWCQLQQDSYFSVRSSN